MEEKDWARDAVHTRLGPLDWPRFANCAFETVDVWTKSLNKRHYIAFLTVWIKSVRGSARTKPQTPPRLLLVRSPAGGRGAGADRFGVALSQIGAAKRAAQRARISAATKLRARGVGNPAAEASPS